MNITEDNKNLDDLYYVLTHPEDSNITTYYVKLVHLILANPKIASQKIKNHPYLLIVLKNQKIKLTTLQKQTVIEVLNQNTSLEEKNQLIFLILINSNWTNSEKVELFISCYKELQAQNKCLNQLWEYYSSHYNINQYLQKYYLDKYETRDLKEILPNHFDIDSIECLCDIKKVVKLKK